jgi:hypothetical protein
MGNSRVALVPRGADGIEPLPARLHLALGQKMAVRIKTGDDFYCGPAVPSLAGLGHLGRIPARQRAATHALWTLVPLALLILGLARPRMPRGDLPDPSKGIDIMLATTPPLGHGHTYAFPHYADAWASLTDAPGWTPEGMAALKAKAAAARP